MNIHPLPVLRDNYIFVLHDPQQQIAAVVDPALAEPVLACIQSLQAELVAIFNTHHHSDHIGGNAALLQKFPQAVVYGGELDRGRIPGQQVFLGQGDQISFGARQAEVIFVPGHTRAHIAYYFPATDNESAELFCGDTLFAGGCGRLFEGTPTQMVESLTKLRQLPPETRVWCAHEYTLNNLLFALSVQPDNANVQARLAAVKLARQALQPTIPSEIALEKLTNPFLRWDQPDLQQAINTTDPIQTFRRLRGMKDLF
jgi:hydroxyacylglutathione hydrolase